MGVNLSKIEAQRINIGLDNPGPDVDTLWQCQELCNEECANSTNLCIEEYSVFRRQPQGGVRIPMFMMAVVGHKITEETWHDWHHWQDDLVKISEWLGPFYDGVLDLFVRMHFAWSTERPAIYASPFSKG